MKSKSPYTSNELLIKPSPARLVIDNTRDNARKADYKFLKDEEDLQAGQDFKNRFRIIGEQAGLSTVDSVEFARQAEVLLSSFIEKKLPDFPKRDFRRGEEDLIEYIRSADGLGPWVDVDKLNRPLMRKIAPGAYNALLDFLRRNELPPDLNIPKKSEVVAAEAVDLSPEAIREARRILSRHQRERSGPGKVSK